MKLKQAVAIRIKELLKSRKLTQYELSQLSGLAESTISSALSSNTKTLTLSTLFDICASLNIELEEFFADDRLKINALED